MKIKYHEKITFAVVCAFTLGWVQTVHAKEPDFQSLPISLESSSLLPAEMLKSTDYSVGSSVSNDGFMNTYSLKSRYGEIEIEGTDKVMERMHEITASIALEEMAKSEEFVDAAGGAIEGLWEGGKSLVTEPKDTIVNATKGIGRWLSNMGDSIVSDNPDQENMVSTALGYDAVKRAYSFELGVDPYTDFQPFQENLGAVSKAKTAGSFITRTATNVATKDTIGTVVTIASVAAMKDLVKDHPPGYVDDRLRERLEKMKISEEQIDNFLKNYHFNTTKRAAFVESLSRMGDIKGREFIVHSAISADDQIAAGFMYRKSEMMANYIEENGPTDIIQASKRACLLTKDKQALFMMAVDYLAWTEEFDTFEKRLSEAFSKTGKIKSKAIFIEGGVSGPARSALESRGWTVKDQVKLKHT